MFSSVYMKMVRGLLGLAFTSMLNTTFRSPPVKVLGPLASLDLGMLAA